MPRAFRSFLNLSLGLMLVAQPVGAQVALAGLPYPAQPLMVTPEVVLAAGRLAGDPEAALKRLLPNVAPGERMARLKSLGKGVLGASNAVLQFNALVILFATMSFQATKEQREFLRLSGQTSLPAQEEGTCKGTGPASEFMCSGEFYMGTLATAGLLGGNKLLDLIVKAILKDASKRVAFLSVLGAFAGTATMLFGATSASFLWGEAVKALPSADLIQKAHGVAGRAAVGIYRQGWQSFSTTEDGKIFGMVLQNMHNILLVDEALRNQWMYNTWRFGIARGEFVASMGTLMSAEFAGQLASMAAAALGASQGLAAPAIGFIVCAGLGTYMLYEVMGSDGPKKITRLMQHTRALKANSDLKNTREEIRYYAQYFKGDKASATTSYTNYFLIRLREAFERASGSREDYVNVQLEQFHELLNEVRALETKVLVAKFVLTKTDLAKDIYMDIDGKYLTLAQAQRRACGSTAFCNLKEAPQLEALEKYPPIIEEANQMLARYAYRIVRVYQADQNLLTGFRDDRTVSFPFPISELFGDQFAKAQALSATLTITLAALSPVFNRTIGLNFSDDQREVFARDLGIYYTQSYSEKKTFSDLLTVAEVAVAK